MSVTKRKRQDRVVPAMSLLLGWLVCGCTTATEKPAVSLQLTAEEMIALTMPVIDCEWHAASRYDDGRSPISSVAERIQGICGPEIMKMRQAFHLPIIDADLGRVQADNPDRGARKDG
jgi:hypothetical protein